MNLKHIKDSSYPELVTEDGKLGFWEDFEDEDTGEVFKIFREVPEGFSFEKEEADSRDAAEHFRAEEAERHEKLYRLWEVESEMEALQYELDTELPERRAQLESDQEDEVGSLMHSDPAKAEEVAQDYGRRFNELDEHEAELEEELEHLSKLRSELQLRVDELWNN